MKIKGRAVVRLVTLGVVLLLTSCPNPIGSPGSRGGALSIQLTNNINARTLLPPIDMTAASFTVSGTGPGAASFSQTTTGGPVTVSDLAFGSWSVTVNALNAGGTIIGSGQATVTVHTGQTATVAISVVPLSGNGTLNLSVTWTASQVDLPSIQATLTPPSGPATPLSFSVSGNQATYSSTTIPAGYQTLTLQLLANNTPVMGAVEVARIVAGQTTTGSYAFTNVNQPGGSVQVNITPAMADPIPVSISGVAATITAGTSVTATASVSDGTSGLIYVWYLNGVSQWTGASYTFGSTLAAGYYRLDVTAYTADGTRAGSATASLQVTGATGSAGHYLYVSNYGSNTVSAYAIGSGGLLTPLSTPAFATGPESYGLAATPNGSFLYVANWGADTLSAYAIGSGGLLTPLSTPTFATGTNPLGIAMTPNGSFLYVANISSNTLSAYSIGSGGLVAPSSTPTFAAGVQPYRIAIAPNGSFLYVTTIGDNTVSAFAIGSKGLLTPLSTPTFPAGGGGPFGIAITPDGSFLYVSNQVINAVSAYAIGSDGLLTPLSTPTFPTGQFPAGIAVTPNGSFLYVANLSSTVSAFAIGPGGLLTPLSTPTFATGMQPYNIAITPDSSFLYVTNINSNSVSAYAIGSGGLLTPLSTPAFATGSAPYGIVIVP